jgi:lactose/L-arabinose transport system ATP-binding protein
VSGSPKTCADAKPTGRNLRPVDHETREEKSMAGLELKQVRKSYGAVDVVHGVDLTISDGEFVVFVGPSGCGKSTLLRMIAGLEDISSGALSIGDQEMTKVAPADRGVAMVFQSYALYPHMSVEENMGFGLKINGFSKEEVRERVLAAARTLQLEPLLQRRPRQLSGGQRQRVAIGRAIVREPDVFLFDEPLSNLDAELRVQMRLEIARLHQSLGTTMIYVTHDQVEAMTLADRIVVLRAGRIEQVGAPMELYEDPDNLFVAGFIGSPKMNFLPVTLVSSSASDIVVRLDDFPTATIPLSLKGAVPGLGDKLMLGVRPEHFKLNSAEGLTVRLDVLENLGAASFAYVQHGREGPLTIEIRDDKNLKAGDSLTIGIDPSRALLFNASSGLRIR